MRKTADRRTVRDPRLERALGELARHRPDLAARNLREAVADCPPGATAQLERRLYWLAVALLRLDRQELALRSLASARKLRPRGFSAAAFTARANEYGMPRKSSPEIDDFYAFYSIQTCLFLARRPGRRFASEAEKDNVTRLVAFAWQEVKRSNKLSGLGTGAKIELFRSWPKVFPQFVVPKAASPLEEGERCACEFLPVDFKARSGRKL